MARPAKIWEILGIPKETPMNQPKKDRDLVLDVYRSFESNDYERTLGMVSPTCTSHIGGHILDRDAWLAMGKMFMTALPDGRHVWELAEESGDYVLLNGYFT